ncbi:MAG: FAD/FMN-dependent dehydrogenase [Gemmatimonadetes bacterium]|nr:FAD/FMN-dependent dehydrogenase [Gemmatimonadota bacterium]
MTALERNWAGNYSYSAQRVHRPESIEQLQDLVRASRKVRALGTRHSFNGIADTDGALISLAHFDRIISLDRARSTVTIEGGVRYGQLGQYLQGEGYALHNLSSLPHISVAGACATATHGSGETNGNLATAVRAMEIVVASGERIAASRETHGDDFDGMVVSLGALGVITSLILEVVPAFDVQQDVYENLAMVDVEQSFDVIQSSAYSVSLFTDWSNDRFTQLWLKRRVPSGASAPSKDSLFGATRATTHLHPIAGIGAESCTAQMGSAGAWCDRLPHFRMEFTPSSGEELQSEYFVSRKHGVAALRAMMALGGEISPLLLVTEIRTIAADTLWMSPCYDEDSVALHFTWKPDWPAVRALLPRIEAALEAFRARPHWGKLFTMPAPHVRSLFERLPDFRRLLETYDPEAKFRNAFIDEYVFAQ